MENQSDPPVSVKASTTFLNKQVLIYIGVLLLGFFLGFGTLFFLGGKIPIFSSLPKKSTIDETKLPISLSLLKNPIVYQWSGSVKGKLIKKDEHNFILIDDQGNSITITDILPSGEKWKAIFFDKANKNKETSYSAIPLNSTLVGNFFIFKTDHNRPVGSSFIKQ